MGFENLTAGTALSERYEIIKKLGTGDTSTVYLALDILIDRQVSIKILTEEYASQNQFVESFKAEAKAVANVIHKNIVAVYDFGEYQGSNFIVMEYLEGSTLKEILEQQGRLSANKAVQIASEVSSGLAYAHDKGLIHGQIEPANIIITINGDVKIADFGVSDGPSNSGKVSSDYFGPEQLSDKPAKPKDDLFSLGVVLHEMVSGSVPKISDGEFDPQTIDAPEWLTKVIGKLLSPVIVNQFTNAADIHSSLTKDETKSVVSKPALNKPESVKIIDLVISPTVKTNLSEDITVDDVDSLIVIVDDPEEQSIDDPTTSLIVINDPETALSLVKPKKDDDEASKKSGNVWRVSSLAGFLILIFAVWAIFYSGDNGSVVASDVADQIENNKSDNLVNKDAVAGPKTESTKKLVTTINGDLKESPTTKKTQEQPTTTAQPIVVIISQTTTTKKTDTTKKATTTKKQRWQPSQTQDPRSRCITENRKSEPFEIFIRSAIGQIGDPFIQGVENSPKDANPSAHDSSEFVQWALSRAGIVVSDQADSQYSEIMRCGKPLGVNKAMRTPGAILFGMSEGRDLQRDLNVAISIGDGKHVIEARPGRGVQVYEVENAKRVYSFGAGVADLGKGSIEFT